MIAPTSSKENRLSRHSDAPILSGRVLYYGEMLLLDQMNSEAAEVLVIVRRWENARGSVKKVSFDK